MDIGHKSREFSSPFVKGWGPTCQSSSFTLHSLSDVFVHPPMKLTNIPSCGPGSRHTTDTNTDDFTALSLHEHFQSSYRNIKAWAAHVEATASLPDLTIVSPTYHSPFIRKSYSQKNHYFEVSLPIPYETVEDIRRQIAATINKQSPWKILKGLPHPHKAPLVSSFCSKICEMANKPYQTFQYFPDADTLEGEYCRVIELRDLFWVQQLMLERQLPPVEYAELFTQIQTLLRDVHTIIDTIENSMIYIRHWGEKIWKMDFDDIEMRRQRRRPTTHPCTLLRPYIIEIPISGTSTPQWPSKKDIRSVSHRAWFN